MQYNLHDYNEIQFLSFLYPLFIIHPASFTKNASRKPEIYNKPTGGRKKKQNCSSASNGFIISAELKPVFSVIIIKKLPLGEITPRT